ncbi:unnamed protein product [marine sediment metagenome]|uniref:Uncharacterized protein n=1 Tax=marine sediment metagenome TaxID=412755 RepID=X0WAC7_9ZZZZ
MAYELLLHMKIGTHITAFAENDESSMLFQKADYVETRNPTW